MDRETSHRWSMPSERKMSVETRGVPDATAGPEGDGPAAWPCAGHTGRAVQGPSCEMDSNSRLIHSVETCQPFRFPLIPSSSQVPHHTTRTLRSHVAPRPAHRLSSLVPQSSLLQVTRSKTLEPIGVDEASGPLGRTLVCHVPPPFSPPVHSVIAVGPPWRQRASPQASRFLLKGSLLSLPGACTPLEVPGSARPNW